MKTFADKVIEFNKLLDFIGELPKGISIMNPFKEDENVHEISSLFYKKYYNDTNRRFLVLGINPGRFGGGLTGIPFTDPKRLEKYCNIKYNGHPAHEPSSDFVYEMISRFGGVEDFYKKFYINSICPLGFTSISNKGKEINYNYYDSRELQNAVFDFMITSLNKQIEFGIEASTCFCFGTGKNYQFLKEINKEYSFFTNVIPLEHPRYIIQYKSKSKKEYINKYIGAFNRVVS